MRSGELSYPLGVYPVEPSQARAGYTVEFEPADSGEDEQDAQWEEWPDRYAYEVVISADRLEALTRAVIGLLPSRVYPILDYLGHDAYREIDPYIAYEPVGLDRFMDGLRAAGPFLFEDGMCGFGAMCDDPFVYFFIDEHKIMTLRVVPENRDRAERILSAFDLHEVEEPRGADAVEHWHRSVVVAPEERPELLSADELVELLRDQWSLTLNIDPNENVDDEGRELGLTGWRCLVRADLPGPEGGVRYVEVVLVGSCHRVAEESALEAAVAHLEVDEATLDDLVLIAADRLSPDAMATAPGPSQGAGGDDGTVLDVRRLG